MQSAAPEQEADPSPTGVQRGGGLWLDLFWEQSHLLFADLFLQGLGSF